MGDGETRDKKRFQEGLTPSFGKSQTEQNLDSDSDTLTKKCKNALVKLCYLHISSVSLIKLSTSGGYQGSHDKVLPT